MQGAVGVVNAVALDSFDQRVVAREKLHIRKVNSIEARLDLPLDEGGETLVEPEVLPVVHRDLVACPGVADLVHCSRQKCLVPCDKR